VTPIQGKQELVLIGLDMNQEELTSMLDHCLLTAEELALGEDGWRDFTDPFSPWLIHESHEGS
jgi:hypothetical protein